jgi:tRNA/tmRNA/rRNA uracil-C5-methylase (TrmA/RlmC/RlmD family)
VVVGAFAPGTHSVVPLDGCEALSDAMRARLPKIVDALPEDAAPAELSTVESLDGSLWLARLTLEDSPEGAARAADALAGLADGVTVVDRAGRVPRQSGEERLWLPVAPGGREVAAAPDAFFQANRFLVAPLASHVRDLAADLPAGKALDAFGGSGLFAASLLDAGHAVTSVEGSREAAAAAAAAGERWNPHPAEGAWRVENAPVLDFAVRSSAREDVVVADPPRAGLGAALARALAARTRSRLIYVSCDPATLARDLAILVPEGFEIRSARLFDLFALTHRVEAVVALDRVRGT